MGYNNEETESMRLKHSHTQIKERKKKQSISERRDKVKSKVVRQGLEWSESL